MRVGVNTLFLIPGEVGGSQTYFCETMRALLKHDPSDSYVFFTNIENDSFLRKQFSDFGNIEYQMLNFKASNRYMRIIREQTELPFRAAGKKLDLLWSPGYTAPLFFFGKQAVTIHDMQYKRFPEDLSNIARLVTHLLVLGAVRCCSRVIAISEFSKSEIVAFAGADPNRVSVTLEGVESAFEEAIDASKTQGVTGSLRNTKFLLCVANTYPHKNVDRLIKAFAVMATDLQLVIVGKPRLGEGSVQKVLSELPVEVRDRIIRLERAEFEELIWLYQNCAAFVFPSLYEGFGLPVLEALSAGVPVVAADIPTSHEIGGTWIWTFDGRNPADMVRVVERAINEPETEKNARIEGGRRHARSFTWAETARRTRECFALACASARR